MTNRIANLVSQPAALMAYYLVDRETNARTYLAHFPSYIAATDYCRANLPLLWSRTHRVASTPLPA